jgi:hypothetical protein
MSDVKTITPLEQRAIDARNAKYGLNRLEYDKVTPRETLPDSLDGGPTKPSIHEVNRREYLKDKYGIKGNSLECEGLLGALIEQSQTLEHASIDSEKERMQHSRLKTATASYKGGNVRLWYTVTK